jgi:hypothetical protein
MKNDRYVAASVEGAIIAIKKLDSILRKRVLRIQINAQTSYFFEY